MKIKKNIILIAIFTIFIPGILLISYKKISNPKHEDPYEIKKVPNFNYQLQHCAREMSTGSLLFLTEQGELYRCESDGEVIKLKLKSINLKVEQFFCFGENQECYFIDNKGDLYYTSVLDPVSSPIKIEGISNVESLSITEGYYGAVTEDGRLYMWLKEKTKVEPEYRDNAPFKSLSSLSPKLIPTISDAKSVACSSNYMAVLTKSGDVYECGIKEEDEEKDVEPVFRKIKDLTKILQIAILKESDLIAIGKDKIYRIGRSGISDLRSENQIDYVIEQMSVGYASVAYVTNHGDSYLLGETFWEHDPDFDLTIPKKLNGIENADAIYGDGVVYVIKDNQIYIIKGVSISWGCK